MLGYFNMANIPGYRPTETMNGGYRQHQRPDIPAASSASCSNTCRLVPPETLVWGGQQDWMQGRVAQILGALTFFLTLVFIIESGRYLSRMCRRRRAIWKEMGRLYLAGDERQLRAFVDDTATR